MTGMRKLLIVVGLLASGVALAQDGWQHELRSVFPEPLDHWMLPWDVTAEPRDISDCWPDQTEIPFLGAEHSFWCYLIPELPMRKIFRDLQTTARDAKMYERLSFLEDTLAMLSVLSYSTGERVDAWYQGEADGGTLVGVAWKAGREPSPLLGPAPAAPSDLLRLP